MRARRHCPVAKNPKIEMGSFEIPENNLKMLPAIVMGDVSCHVSTQPNPKSHRSTFKLPKHPSPILYPYFPSDFCQKYSIYFEF